MFIFPHLSCLYWLMPMISAFSFSSCFSSSFCVFFLSSLLLEGSLSFSSFSRSFSFLFSSSMLIFFFFFCFSISFSFFFCFFLFSDLNLLKLEDFSHLGVGGRLFTSLSVLSISIVNF